MDKLIVAVDFDSTLFTEVYPGIGELIPGARETVNWLYDAGHKIIINTCREGVHAEVAMAALNQHGIKWHYFNTNDPERVDKFKHDSRKIGADISIDDRDIHVKSNGGIVDWEKTRKMLERIVNPKPIIVCVVGGSGVGKTHMVSYMEERYGIPMIESYTDRTKRIPNEKGHTFLTKEEFDDLNMADMIAFTCWKGESGDIVRYCCLEKDIDHPVMTYVIDERGLKYLKKYWSDRFCIFTVRLFAADHLREQHASRERMDRDKGNFNLSLESFDYFIDNDYSDKMYEKYDNLYKRIQAL
jgi:guanylate kinase